MTNELEKTFFDTFGIEPRYEDTCTVEDKYWNNEELANEYGTFDQYMNCKCGNQENCTTECSCAYQREVYPQITDSILLGLEEIFAHKKINGAGFFDGFHVKKYDDYWIYQLTYYKGGYYTCGFGKTRKEAFLNQLITILNDKEVEEKEKQLIKHQVRTLFEEG